MIATYDVVAYFSLRQYRSRDLSRRYRCAAMSSLSWLTNHCPVLQSCQHELGVSRFESIRYDTE